MVRPDSCWVSRVQHYLDTARVLWNFAYGALTLYGRVFQLFLLFLYNPTLRSRNPSNTSIEGLGCFPVRSPLLRESRLISFPPVTEMFQFTGFARCTYESSATYSRICGFPHSEIAGSKVVCHLTDAYRRLPRLSSPSTAKASTMCASSLSPFRDRRVKGCLPPHLGVS